MCDFRIVCVGGTAFTLVITVIRKVPRIGMTPLAQSLFEETFY